MVAQLMLGVPIVMEWSAVVWSYTTVLGDVAGGGGEAEEEEEGIEEEEDRLEEADISKLGCHFLY